MQIRLVKDTDSAALIAIVASCFAQYPNCILDLLEEEPELLAPATRFNAKRAVLWVLEDEKMVKGCVGLKNNHTELVKFYVDPTVQGQGYGRYLMDHCLAESKAQSIKTLSLWTDTRFTRAHSLYEKAGFIKTGQTRTLNDKSKTSEFYYELTL